MKDLEIRGAGNLLGPQQSGHVAAVGYEMYCQLLRTAVERARDDSSYEPVVLEVDVDLQLAAFLPDTFVTSAKERLEMLRDMDGATTPENAVAIRSDLADRFGRLPQPVENLLRVFLLKHLLLAHEVIGIQRTDSDRIVVRHPRGRPLGGAWLDAFADVRTVEAGKTHLMLPPPKGKKRATFTGEQALQLLLDSLCRDTGLPRIGERCGAGRKQRRRSPSSARR